MPEVAESAQVQRAARTHVAQGRRGIAANFAKLPELLGEGRGAPETTSGLLWPGAGHPAEIGDAGDVTSLANAIVSQGLATGETRWTSALKPPWPTFSFSRVKNRT